MGKLIIIKSDEVKAALKARKDPFIEQLTEKMESFFAKENAKRDAEFAAKKDNKIREAD